MTEHAETLWLRGRVFELLDAEDQTPEAEVKARAGRPRQIEDVSFRYLPDRPLIEAVSDVKPDPAHRHRRPHRLWQDPPSSICSCGFYDVNGGSIKVSGTDIRMLTRASLRGSYGMVLQDTWLGPAPCENIAYGKPDAS